MKKILYSIGLKIAAVFLLTASIVLGMLAATNGVIRYCNEDNDIYSFEHDFSESWYISYLLGEPESAVSNAYASTFRRYDAYGTPIDWVGWDENDMTGSAMDLETNIRTRFAEPYFSDEINYYVQWNDLVFTNGAGTPEELMQGEYYTYVKRHSDGRIERKTSVNRGMSRVYLMEEVARFDNTSTIVISCNIKEETVREYKAIWEMQERIVMEAVIQTGGCAVAALLLLIYLICVCGKTPEGAYKNMWLDRVWLEFHLTALTGGILGTVVLCFQILDQFVNGYFPQRLLYLTLGTVTAAGSLILITALLSIVRNIKTRSLLETSVIFRLLRWLFRWFGKLLKWIWGKAKAFCSGIFRLLSKKTGVILFSALLLYTAIIGILGIGTVVSPIWFVIGVLFFGGACFLVACRVKDLEEIKNGVHQVRDGNTSYKIPQLMCEDMRVLAENINDIARGLDESVAAKVKAERLKSELITNVSHDLKTPITSIINYTELLFKVEGLPEEARDYVSVIGKKSERLKNLTQDLFDISKAQSGNEDVNPEKLNVALLVEQALGEQDQEIRGSGLTFCVETPKELHIFADGRKLSRVLGNLIQNILKYTMKNTRVFITASEKDGEVKIELKNISAYPLNVDAEEITQRFVRGDASRTAEGNGLGLAIAKSYTEVCGGSFEIVIDGDMFKAIMQFKRQD